MNYKRFPLGGLWTNGYLFYDDNGDAFFIDPGGDAREVFDFSKLNKMKIKAVLLTHGHLDHLAGIEGFIPLVGESIYISSEDSPYLKQPPEDMQMALGMTSRGAEKFKTITDGDVLTGFAGGFEVKVIATPGHTPGSVCYLISLGDEQILASGDTLFAQSVGRTDLPGGDERRLMESIMKLAEMSDDLEVLPGHGPATNIGRERRSNPFWPR
ncbi:MBL fold metallo-hydrolase [Synergistales bacterium]|nr:MBL fold metallo-hydrolase [Synergistales bacterium]